MITAFLLSPPSRTSNTETREEEHFPCVETLDDVLGKFAKKVENQGEFNANRMRSLHSLAAHTATFGEKLFAHPSTWIFQWTTQSTPHPSRNTSEDTENVTTASPDEEEDAIVLFPALLRSDAPAKAGKQKGRAIVVQPAEVGSGFVSKEITILEKKKNEPTPSLDAGFSIVEPRDVELLRSNTGREHASRSPPVRRQSIQAQPHYPNIVEADCRERMEKVQLESSRGHYSAVEYGTRAQSCLHIANFIRRRARKKNRSQSARY
ncbi:hypothetical protein EG329_014445 [Mollisiaceae sp. DMI_Dod_QoI]|nr:hypothetical protein EG329_014445 [Helotiales sp. DMI_Dod_QoI]